MSLTPRFHTLRVADVRRETADAVSVAFDVPESLRADYAFSPGQYLTLRMTRDGAEQRRSYSICAGPDDGELRIAVKRVDGGMVSSWINGALAGGDLLDVMTPTGRFGVAPAPEQGRTYVGFAAGSGITPILSIMRGALQREPRSRFFLFYGNRATGDMLFRDALDMLKDRYIGRLSIFHVLSQEQQDIAILNGRLDAAKARVLLRHLVPAGTVDHAFICGPEAMSDELREALVGLGVPNDRVHVERFVSALGGVPRERPAPPIAAAPFATASLIVDGKRRDVPVAENEAVLDAALRAGLDLPYACKGGMCSTCRARLLEGSVRMVHNYALEQWETDAGFVLTCQARPTSARVVIDYDQV